ncbi:MAG: Lrp/AsnC ligand binding domain-containing protein [Pseudomonadota bacterium]
MLDPFDQRILETLARDGRITVTELAARIGLSKTPCQARMRRLEREGYILGYRARLNWQRIDRAHIAFVQARLERTTEAALTAFNRAVLQVPEIEECHMIAGGFDYLLKIRTADITAYRRVLAEEISTLPHIAQTATFVAMEAVKEAGESLGGVDPRT